MITVFIREDEKTVSVGVQDQGIGIAENKRKSLFLRFENLVDKNLFNQASTDPRYFSKCFKAQLGMTPTEYRDRVMNK